MRIAYITRTNYRTYDEFLKIFDFVYTMNKQKIVIPSGIGLTTVLGVGRLWLTLGICIATADHQLATRCSL